VKKLKDLTIKAMLLNKDLTCKCCGAAQMPCKIKNKDVEEPGLLCTKCGHVDLTSVTNEKDYVKAEYRPGRILMMAVM